MSCYCDMEKVYDFLTELGHRVIDVPYPDGGGVIIIVTGDKTECRLEYDGDER